MLTKLFFWIECLLGLMMLIFGLCAYLKSGARWDAGAMHLFAAFWFFLSAYGFYLRNGWVVGMAAMVRLGTIGMYLFIALMGIWHQGGPGSRSDTRLLAAAVGLALFTIAGTVVAIHAHRTTPSETND